MIHLAKSWCLQHRYRPLSWVKRPALYQQDTLTYGGHPDQVRLTPETPISLSWLRRKPRHDIPTETSTTNTPKDRRDECYQYLQVLFGYGVNAPANLEYCHFSQPNEKTEHLRSIPCFFTPKIQIKKKVFPDFGLLVRLPFSLISGWARNNFSPTPHGV